MKDIAGQDLNIGDFVVTTRNGSQIQKCRVIGFTARKVRLLPYQSTERYRIWGPGRGERYDLSFVKFNDEVALIPEPLV